MPVSDPTWEVIMSMLGTTSSRSAMAMVVVLSGGVPELHHLACAVNGVS